MTEAYFVLIDARKFRSVRADNLTRVEESPSYAKLVALLREVGVRTAESGPTDATGFPASVPLADGGSLLLDLQTPPLIDRLDPEGVGAAIVDMFGCVKRTWGIARRNTLFRQSVNLLDSPIGPLLESTYDGSSGVLYLDGVRYFTAGLSSAGSEGPVTEVFVLLVNANDEKQAKRQARRSERFATTLRRMGKALSMNQHTQTIAIASAHELASSAELAAALVWVHQPHTKTLHLSASVGFNRNGVNAFGMLSSEGTPGCLAEAVATTRQPYHGGNVNDHVMSSQLEAKYCYLKPGAIGVYPLVASDRLLGVLELIGREDDPHFDENREMFATVAEQLALALNSATLFEEFERLATHDPLTGLANHRSMQEFLSSRISESQRTGAECSLLMIDVDHFRAFNEEEGHDVGDQVLVQVADCLRQCLRPYDLAARYGGEEFTLVLPSTGKASAFAVAERIRTKVAVTPLVTRSGRERHLTVSVGAAGFPETATDAASLIKAADLALYESKRGGRNRVTVYQGTYANEKAEVPVDHDVFLALTPDQAEVAEGRLGRLDPWIEQLVPALRLSRPQVRVLRALVAAEMPYREAVAAGRDQEFLARPEMRVLAPSLLLLDERFDGRGPAAVSGPHIPLLARVMSVLAAIDSGSPKAFLSDPGRFDPDVLEHIAGWDRAA